MPFCNVCSRDRLGLLVVLMGALVSAPVQAQAPVSAPVVVAPVVAPMTLDQLLARFAGMSGLSAKFREEKRMALLAAPLVNEGILYFAPKGRLAAHPQKSPTTGRSERNRFMRGVGRRSG